MFVKSTVTNKIQHLPVKLVMMRTPFRSIITTSVPKQCIQGSQYEKHASMILKNYGFSWRQQMGSPGDEGVDLRGHLSLSGAHLFDVIGQCKCTERSLIGPNCVRELIGVHMLKSGHNSIFSLVSLFISNAELSSKATEVLNHAPVPMAYARISHMAISDQENTSSWQGELEAFYLNMKLQAMAPEFTVNRLHCVDRSYPVFFYKGKPMPLPT